MKIYTVQYPSNPQPTTFAVVEAGDDRKAVRTQFAAQMGVAPEQLSRFDASDEFEAEYIAEAMALAGADAKSVRYLYEVRE